jgi:hypothetical protein
MRSMGRTGVGWTGGVTWDVAEPRVSLAEGKYVPPGPPMSRGGYKPGHDGESYTK